MVTNPTLARTAASTEAQHPRTSMSLVTRRLLAAAVVGAPALIAVNSIFHPTVDMSGAGVLAGAETGASTWFTVHMVAALGALLGVPAAIGLRSLVPVRGRRLASAGVALTVIGSPLLALGFASEASVLRLAAAELDPAAALTLAEAYARTPEFYAVGVAVMLVTLANLLIGMGLVASRSLPPALPALYLLGTIAAAAAAPGTPIGPIAFGLVTAASIPLAVRMLGEGRHDGQRGHARLG